MLFTQALLGLVTAASTVAAIDLHIYWDDRGCKKGTSRSTWRNAADNKCHWDGNRKHGKSFAIEYVPSNWKNIDMFAWTGHGCNHQEVARSWGGTGGNSAMCVGASEMKGEIGSAKYFFYGRKREDDKMEAAASKEDCKRSPLPDFYSFGENVHYNLTGLDEASINKIRELHESKAEIPAEFTKRLVSQEVVDG